MNSLPCGSAPKGPGDGPIALTAVTIASGALPMAGGTLTASAETVDAAEGISGTLSLDLSIIGVAGATLAEPVIALDEILYMFALVVFAFGSPSIPGATLAETDPDIVGVPRIAARSHTTDPVASVIQSDRQNGQKVQDLEAAIRHDIRIRVYGLQITRSDN